MVKQETWILDIETKPLVVYAWERKDIYVNLDQIKEDWSVLAWSAKRLGEPANKIVYFDLRHAKDYTNDKPILRPLWDILNQADIVITQNGKKFDGPKLNARFMFYKMGKPAEYKHFDTYLLASKVASFTSTKLEYLTSKLNRRYKKFMHDKFPGMSLWTECLKGNLEAWDEMKKYNIRDVLSTEELAIELKEWAPKAFPDWEDEKCASCGKVKKLKVKCQACGKWGAK